MDGDTEKVRIKAPLIYDHPALTTHLFVVVPDGYGLSYSIGNDYIRWTITSLKLDSEEFKACLADAAKETRQMMERARQTESIKTKL